MNDIEFKEVQRFRVWWAWLGAIALNVLFIYAIVQQLILGIPFGSKPAPNLALILIELGPLLLIVFLMSIKLRTKIDNEGIHYRFFPFQLNTKNIEWHELNNAYIRKYNSFHEYGGWGIRYGNPKTGMAINTSESGSQGLQLRFHNGSLLLIGTKDAAAIQMILDQVYVAGKINRNV